MKPTFWKISQGVSAEFSFGDMIESIANQLVYIHMNTSAKGTMKTSQAQDFVSASIGDYFYLTNGNQGIYLIGQFSGRANLAANPKYEYGWLERPYTFVCPAITRQPYTGVHKWWSPNDNSTFTQVYPDELELFEQEILQPFFDKNLSDFGLDDL
ncbi:MAG: hypothetical protein ACH34X_07590 [Thiolinea sp.]